MAEYKVNIGVFQKIFQKTKKDFDNFELYNAMFLLCRQETDNKQKWEMCRLLKEAISVAINKKAKCSTDLLDVYDEILLLEARGLRFDSYMQYVEMNRPPQERFWLPRRTKLMPLCNEIQKLIDDELDILTISIAPGVGKSTLEQFLLSMLIGDNPNSPCLASGHSGTLTQGIYDGVMDIITDKDTYRWGIIFPDAGALITNAKEQKIDLGKKRKFSSLTCRAINATLTGATRCERLLCADDMVSGIEEAVNAERMDKLWSEIQTDLLTRTKLDCKILFIGTRWSVNDPIGKLKQLYSESGDKRFKEYVLPALDENDESTIDFDYRVGFNTSYLHDKRSSMDDLSFRALFMNQPVEREGLLYPNESLKRYFDLPDGEPTAIISVCDTKDKGSDYCCMPIGYLYGENWYIADIVCDNSLPDVFIPRLIEHTLNNNVQLSKYESNSAGGRIAEEVRKALKSVGARTSISTEYTTTNKETKILVNSDWVKQHCYFKDSSLYHSKDDYGVFMSMLCTYTLTGKNNHDDAPDSMAMFALFAQKMTTNKVEVFRRPF